LPKGVFCSKINHDFWYEPLFLKQNGAIILRKIFQKTMFPNMKKLTAPALGLLVAGLLFIDPAFAQLIDTGDNPSNIEQSTTFGGSFRSALRTIVNYFLFFLGIVATVMVIYGGFLYITSGGDESGAEKGKKILIYAAIGIIIILISFALVNTLLQAGTNTPPPL
jgi:hypothetical protein